MALAIANKLEPVFFHYSLMFHLKWWFCSCGFILNCYSNCLCVFCVSSLSYFTRYSVRFSATILSLGKKELVLNYVIWLLVFCVSSLAMVSSEPRKSYAHQMETTGSSNDSYYLHPFSKWQLFLKERICFQR